MKDKVYTFNNQEEKSILLKNSENFYISVRLLINNIKSIKLRVNKVDKKDQFHIFLRIKDDKDKVLNLCEVSSKKIDEEGFINFKINPMIIGCYDKELRFEFIVRGIEKKSVIFPVNSSGEPCIKLRYEDISVELEDAIRKTTKELERIYASSGWKMLINIYKIRDSVVNPLKKLKKLLKLILKINPSNIEKAIKYIKKHGVRSFIDRIILKSKGEIQTSISYEEWLRCNKVKPNEIERQRNHKFNYSPKISIIVPIFNTPEKFLREMLDSVIEQTYSNWELCIADASDKGHRATEILKNYQDLDKRIKVEYLDDNKGISENTNECLKLVSGEYVGLFDHDDLLTKDALHEVVKVINDKDADFIYSDEDKTDEHSKKRADVHFKPDFAQDTLLSNNYICHFTVIKKSLLDLAGWFRKEYDGAQDHDLFLRVTDKAKTIIHIPKVLYHWRVHSGSTAGSGEAKMYAFEAGKNAVSDFLTNKGIDAEVEIGKYLGTYKVNYKLKDNPLVSIIIPTMDHIDDLQRCIESIVEKSSYNNYEIILVENNSKKPQTFEYYEKLKENDKVKIVYWKNEFNYSAINNFGAKHANGEHFILLNNDTEIISKDWIERMLQYSQREDVGIVGAKLYYPDDTVQHGGVIIGMGGIAGHIHNDFGREAPGYFARLSFVQNFSAVTAACLMVRKDVFDKVGGLNEDLKVAFNDIDFCLEVRKAGYLIIWSPYVELYHYESKSRGEDDTEEKRDRFLGEVYHMEEKWSDILKEGDPYYNINLSLMATDYSLNTDM